MGFGITALAGEEVTSAEKSKRRNRTPVDGVNMPFYSSRHASESHRQGNQFDLGNTS